METDKEKLETARRLLEEVFENGLMHECAMEGYYEFSGYSCSQCKSDLESKIANFLNKD